MDSHRAELSGAISFFTFISMLKNMYQYVDDYNYTCDNEGFIKIMQRKNKVESPDGYDRKNQGLQETLRRLIKDTPK